MTMTTYSLPDGSTHTLPLPQARRVWQIWLALAPVATARGEGVAVSVEDGSIEITTVHAAQWEGVRVVCPPDGTAVWCSEQSAPDLPGCDFRAAPPPGPWEREGFEARCIARELAEMRGRLLSALRGEEDGAHDARLRSLGILEFWRATGVAPSPAELGELRAVAQGQAE